MWWYVKKRMYTRFRNFKKKNTLMVLIIGWNTHSVENMKCEIQATYFHKISIDDKLRHEYLLFIEMVLVASVQERTWSLSLSLYIKNTLSLSSFTSRNCRRDVANAPGTKQNESLNLLICKFATMTRWHDICSWNSWLSNEYQNSYEY